MYFIKADIPMVELTNPESQSHVVDDENPFAILAGKKSRKYGFSLSKLDKNTFKDGQLNYSQTSPAFSGSGVKQLAIGVGVEEVAGILANAFPGEATNIVRGVANRAANVILDGETNKANARINNDVTDIYQQEQLRYQENLDQFYKRRLTGLTKSQTSYFTACLLNRDEIDPNEFTAKTKIKITPGDYEAVMEYAESLAAVKTQIKTQKQELDDLREKSANTSDNAIGELPFTVVISRRNTAAANMAQHAQEYKNNAGNWFKYGDPTQPKSSDAAIMAQTAFKHIVEDYVQLCRYSRGETRLDAPNPLNASNIQVFAQANGWNAYTFAPWAQEVFTAASAPQESAASQSTGTVAPQAQSSTPTPPTPTPPAAVAPASPAANAAPARPNNGAVGNLQMRDAQIVADLYESKTEKQAYDALGKAVILDMREQYKASGGTSNTKIEKYTYTEFLSNHPTANIKSHPRFNGGLSEAEFNADVRAAAVVYAKQHPMQRGVNSNGAAVMHEEDPAQPAVRTAQNAPAESRIPASVTPQAQEAVAAAINTRVVSLGGSLIESDKSATSPVDLAKLQASLGMLSQNEGNVSLAQATSTVPKTTPMQSGPKSAQTVLG